MQLIGKGNQFNDLKPVFKKIIAPTWKFFLQDSSAETTRCLEWYWDEINELCLIQKCGSQGDKFFPIYDIHQHSLISEGWPCIRLIIFYLAKGYVQIWFYGAASAISHCLVIASLKERFGSRLELKLGLVLQKAGEMSNRVWRFQLKRM